MALLEGILGWLIEKLLSYVMARAARAAQDLSEQNKKDAEREKANEENVKRYEEAKNRADRIAAALALLNRTP